MTYAAIPDHALDDLRQAYRDGELVLFVGAGVSAAAGLPSWAKLVEKLVERARARGATAGVLDEIDKLATSGRLIDALTAAKSAVGAGDFGAAVEAALDDQKKAWSRARQQADPSPARKPRGAGAKGSACWRARF